MDDKRGINSKLLKAVGQFFYGENFNEPAFVVSRGNYGFKVDKDQLNDIELYKEVQSVRWITNFTPKVSGGYKFEITPNLFTHILIDGQDVKNKEIQLEANKMYRFIVAYFDNPSVEQRAVYELEVKYEFNQQESKDIEVENFSIPQIITFDGLPGTKTPLMLDTDEDGIYDEWEINGYTVIKGVVKKWKEEYASLGYKKYVSNPYESHTAGDPYSDLEKASGALDRTIKEVAWDPMVAAFPSITIGMESLILSNNKEIGSSQGKTASNTTSSSIGTSNTEGENLSISSSLEDFSVSTSVQYSQTSIQTVDSAQTSGQEWSEQLSLNTGQAAYVNANLRYYNVGTAPVYNLVPTTNLVLGRETIATITAQLNQQAMGLDPGQTYPKSYLHGIGLNTLDQFSSSPISVNIDQLQRLEIGEKLKLETTQIQGNFASRDPAGGQVIIGGNDWKNYLPQIEKVTAGILINIKNKKKVHRRIAARNPKNPNDLTPELTLGQALEKAFGATYDKKLKTWYFIDEETDNKHTLNPHLMYFVYDNKTQKMIERGSEDVEKIYDIKIRPGMNIEINIPEISEDFQGNSVLFTNGELNDTNGLNNDRCYTIKPKDEILTKEIDIRNEYVYLVMFDIKGKGKGEETISVYVNGLENEAEVLKKISFSNEYKRKAITFNTFNKEKEETKIVIKSISEEPVYIDNFSIINLGHQFDILKQENRDIYSKIKNNVYQVCLKNLSQTMTLANKNLFVLPFDSKRFQNFKFIYEPRKNAFYIKPDIYPTDNMVLTWEKGSQNLTFIRQREKIIDTRQLWYITHVKNNTEWEGFRIISCYDRSKCLDYSFIYPKDGQMIKIETIEYSNKSQLFLAVKVNNL